MDFAHTALGERREESVLPTITLDEQSSEHRATEPAEPVVDALTGVYIFYKHTVRKSCVYNSF